MVCAAQMPAAEIFAVEEWSKASRNMWLLAACYRDSHGNETSLPTPGAIKSHVFHNPNADLRTFTVVVFLVLIGCSLLRFCFSSDYGFLHTM
jgi:hypothetical protein